MKTTLDSDLQLATTVFKCPSPHQEPLGYPRILVAAATSSWDSIQFDGKASRIARSVVEACRLDPNTATSADMNQLNPVLECLDCQDVRGRLAMRWIQTVPHFLSDWGFPKVDGFSD
jgi:hypothetical protein